MKESTHIAKEVAAKIAVLFGGNGLTTIQATDGAAALIEEALDDYVSWRELEESKHQEGA